MIAKGSNCHKEEVESRDCLLCFFTAYTPNGDKLTAIPILKPLVP
jgi:hypothetical protein